MPAVLSNTCLFIWKTSLLRRLGLVQVFSKVVFMAGKCCCPCSPNAGEPKAVALSTAHVATTLSPADEVWSTSRDKAVRLRMEGSDMASETPITVHQLFLETVESYGDNTALVSKKDGQLVTLTWRQYYQQCRAAAKSFLKVCLQINSAYINQNCITVCTVWSNWSAIRKYLDTVFVYFMGILNYFWVTSIGIVAFFTNIVKQNSVIVIIYKTLIL